MKDSILTASAEVSDGEVDMLLVDCDPGDTERILKVWIPKLAAGALVWVHDYGDPKEFGSPFDRYEKNEAVSRDVGVIVGEGLLEEVKVSGLGWLGRLGGWSGQEKVGMTMGKPEQDSADISEESTAEAIPEDDQKAVSDSPSESPEPSPDLADQPAASPQGDSPPTSEEPGKKKAGRPKGSKNKPKDD